MFFECVNGSVNGENYLEMLQEVVMPQLQIKPNFDELFFQQSGTPPHYALRVRDITFTKSFQSVGSEEEVALNGHHARRT